MDLCTQTILHFLQDSQGHDAVSPSTERLAKKLSRNVTIQYYVNELKNELSHELEKRPQRVRRSSLKKLKESSRQLKRCKPFKNALSDLPMLDVIFKVPNLTLGIQFNEVIKPLENLTGELQFFCAKGHETIAGLSIDESNFLIKGMIESSGDYEVKLFCILLLPTGECQRVQGKLKITVIPDPRSLWKNIPSDALARFHKPDTASDTYVTDSVISIAASVRGRSHAHKGTHRDDDIKILYSSASKWNVICVADGAGSCKYSRRGAELAVLRGAETLRETLNGHYGFELEHTYAQHLSNPNEKSFHQLQEIFQHTMVKAVFNVVMAIQEEVKNNEEDNFKDYSTTLLLAAHKPVEDGHLIISFWIGDGAPVVYDKGNSVTLLGKPDSGEYAGQVRFLDTAIFDDSSVYSRVKMIKVDSMTALILATDGITDAWFDTEKQLSSLEHWDTLWSEIEPFVGDEDLKKGEADLIQWMDFWSTGNHDDRSIAICYIKK
jgi:serine/threonine protein phosphatase PrpC